MILSTKLRQMLRDLYLKISHVVNLRSVQKEGNAVCIHPDNKLTVTWRGQEVCILFDYKRYKQNSFSRMSIFEHNGIKNIFKKGSEPDKTF